MAHLVSHQACPSVHSIARLTPQCAVALLIAHFQIMHELDVFFTKRCGFRYTSRLFVLAQVPSDLGT